MSKRRIGVDADVWSEGSLEVLSQHETDFLKNFGTGGPPHCSLEKRSLNQGSLSHSRQRITIERLIQYLDDLDVLAGMIGLIVEKMRQATLTLFSYLAVSVSVSAIVGVWIALVHGPLAIATLILLFVTMLYRTVTSLHSGVPPQA